MPMCREEPSPKRFRAPLLLGLFLLAGAFTGGGVVAGDTQLQFRAKVEDLSIQQGNPLTRGMSRDREIIVLMPGRLYRPAPVIKPTSAAPTPTILEDLLVRDYWANRSGDAANLARLFVPSERARVISWFAENPAALRRNKAFFDGVDRVELEGWARRGRFVFALVTMVHKGRRLKRVYTYRSDRKSGVRRLLRTNQLSKDPHFDVVFNAYRLGQVKAVSSD